MIFNTMIFYALKRHREHSRIEPLKMTPKWVGRIVILNPDVP